MSTYIDIGHGDVVVFVHGLGNRKEVWEGQKVLARNFRMIIPDLRGHGNSPEKEELTVANFAADIIGYLDRLGIKQAHFCGLSLGGIIVQEIYKEYNSYVKSMILCNTTSYVPTVLGNYFTKNAFRDIEKEDFLEQVAKACIHEKEDADIMRKAERGFLIHIDSLPTAAKAGVGKNYLPVLPFNKKPVLIIAGEKDQVISPFNAYLTHMFTPFSTLRLFKNTGHLSNVEKEYEFNETVLSFLQNVK